MTTEPRRPESTVARGAPPSARAALRLPAWLLSACLLGLAVLLGRPAAAQTTVTFESFGVGNVYRPGGPVAAQLVVTSDLDEAVPGLIEWEVPNPDGDLQLNRRLIEIPARGGTARTWLLGDLPSRNVASAVADEPWTVRVYEYRDGRRVREIATARLSPTVCAARPIEQSRGLALVIGPNDAGLSGYGVIPGRDSRPGLNEYLDVITGVEPADLPDVWPGLQQIDLLVWTADDSRFQPATLGTRLVVEGAIRSWLERGGHLVIALPRTGDPWRLARGDGVLDDLLDGIAPITESDYPLRQALPALADRPGLRDPDRTITLHRFDPETLPPAWRPLAGFRPSPPPFDPASVAIPEGTPPAVAERLVEAARDAIAPPAPVVHAVRRDVGQGTLDIVGIDPSDPDIRVQQPLGLPATWVFWNPVLGRRTFTVPASTADALAATRELVVATSSEAIGRTPFVSDEIGLRGSSSGGLLVAVVIFGGYWLIAGPVGFAFLGRIKRRRHAWLAFALTSLVAAGVSWIVGSLVVEVDASLRHLTVLRHRYEPTESGIETPLDHATCWFSARLPGYGVAEVVVGDDDTEEAAGPDLLRHYSPPPNGFGTGFPDVDRYEADARRTDRLVVPSRATSAEFVADWSGRPRAVGDVWSSSIKVAPDDPVRVTMIDRELVSIDGTLVNGTGLPLSDVMVLLVAPVRSGPLPLGGDGLPGVAGTGEPRTAEPPNLGVMLSVLSTGWAADGELRLGSSAGFQSPRLLRRFDRDSLGGQFDAFFAVADDGVFGVPTGGPAWQTSRQLQALSMFQMLPPPPLVQKSAGGRPGVRMERLLGRGLDLSRHLAEPSLVVLATASQAPCPVPITVDGEDLPGEGTVLLQWIHPLRPDVEWLVPPRPAAFDETTDEPGRDENAQAVRSTTDSDAKGVAVAWR